MKKIRNISIQKKISCLFLGCFLIFLICIILILHHVYKKQIYQEMLQRGHYEDELIVHQMERLSQNVESCCNNIIINMNISIGGKAGLAGSLEEYDQRTREKVLGVIENNFILFPDISEIFILYNNGDLYTKEKNQNFHASSDNMRMVEELKDTQVSTLGMWYYYENTSPSIYYLKVFNDISDNSQIGYVLLELKEEVIYKSYRNQKTENPSEIYIFDENGRLLSSNQREIVECVYLETEKENKLALSDKIYGEISDRKQNSDYYVKEYETSGGWTVISILDLKAGMTGLQSITWNIVILGIGLFVIFFCVIVRILGKIVQPIVTLAGHMRKTGENLIQKIEEPNSKDEVGVLISSFNQMVDMNGKLIQKVEQNEKEKRRLELALLQMQIKPHFLYNTLDTAFCLNSMQKYQEANHVIKQLAEYYRLVLNHGDEWINFVEELDAVEKYLEIQSVRYSNLISYTIDVDEELYGFRIPKMTLQPLVENAIYHGIKPAGRKGNILISGELCDDKVKIAVIDDGVGMSQAMFDEILNGKRKSTDGESFGMKSVVERLRLFYGDAKMDLGQTDEGTSIVLSIDLRKDVMG